MNIEDFDSVKRAAVAAIDQLLFDWFPNGVVEGSEFCVGSLSGEAGQSLRVHLKGERAGVWSDFSIDGEAGGDLISLYAAKERISQGRACAQLARDLGVSIHDKDGRKYIPAGQISALQKSPPAQAGKGVGAPAAPKKKQAKWEPILPIPDSALPYPKAHVVRGWPQMFWEYRDQEGRLLGVVYRFITSDGGKEVLPCVFARNEITGTCEWRWLQWREPRPLYLPRPLRENFEVLVVEGEKAADAAVELYGVQFDVVSWPGGGKAVKKVDWSPLAGRSCLFWADADAKRYKENHPTQAGEIMPETEQPGMKAMQWIAGELQGLGCRIQFVDIPEPGVQPDGWDVADLRDSGAGEAEFLAWINRRRPVWVAPAVELAAPVPSDSGDAADNVPDWVAGAPPELGDVPLPRAGAEPMDPQQIKSTVMVWGKYGVTPCRENVFYALMYDPRLQGIVAYDQFAELPMKVKPNPWGSPLGEWSETDDFYLGLYLAKNYGLTISSVGDIEKAVAQVARVNGFNPVTEFFESCAQAWDGTSRIEGAFSKYWGAEDSEYMRLVSTMFFVALAARAFNPGIKHDHAPVFEGGQGAGKSTALAVLGGEWYAETPFKMGDKDGYMAIQGILIYEIAELEQFNRSELTAVKAFMTNKNDRFREPYGRRMKNLPRRTVFAGTTNEGQYFKDTTGNRRFWPVACGRILLEQLKADREQLIGEAVARWREGVHWWPTPDQQRILIGPVQDDREIPDQWVGKLYDYVEGIDIDGKETNHKKDRVTARELLTRALHIEIGKLSSSKAETMRVSACMRKLGWEKKRDEKGAREYYYARPKPEAGTVQEVDYDIPV
ncbi:putative P-loop ATPase [Herbaspirillum seropedicae]|uniref:VapE domain-containing protein n=1 Tax=Herbaspirillum seropedicae TaxID=964 RepID=UPI00339103B5